MHKSIFVVSQNLPCFRILRIGRAILFTFFTFHGGGTSAENKLAVIGKFTNESCIKCHIKSNPKLIADWKRSKHGTAENRTNCVSCHGSSHETAGSASRRNSSCTSCHGDKNTPVVHSYNLSRHGVLMTLEENSYDWNQPLENANYRSPSCAYCHMHEGNHYVESAFIYSSPADSLKINSDQKGKEIRRVCLDCHAPRYTEMLFSNGDKMFEIAAMKFREAELLINNSTIKYSNEEMRIAKKQFEIMKNHLLNVWIGTGHQSPDYQWWHGQPALDGDLLRIKGMILELERKKNLEIKQ